MGHSGGIVWTGKEVNGLTEEEYLVKRVVEDSRHPNDVIPTLNGLYGNNRSSNAARKKLGSMGHRITDLNLLSLEDRAFTDDNEDALAQIFIRYEQDLREKDTQIARWRKKYRLALDERSLQDALLGRADEAIEGLPIVEAGSLYTPPSKTVGKQETVVALFSDTHWGEVVNPEETFGFNQYNWTIARRRAAFYVDTITDLVTNRLVGYDMPKLEFWMLGDMLSGMIHQELIATSDLNVMDAVFGGALLIAQMLRDLAQIFPEINVIGVVGNHPRTTKKPAFKEKYVNWDYTLYNLASIILKDQENITWNIPKSFFTMYEVFPHQTFLITHGDTVMSYRGIPWYGIEREINAFTALMASKERYFPYAVMGHFHNAADIDRIAGEYFINGSVMGGSEYSIGKLVTSSPPRQHVFGVHPNKGVSWRYKIQLDYGDDNTNLDRYPYNPDIQLLDQVRAVLK